MYHSDTNHIMYTFVHGKETKFSTVETNKARSEKFLRTLLKCQAVKACFALLQHWIRRKEESIFVN